MVILWFIIRCTFENLSKYILLSCIVIHCWTYYQIFLKNRDESFVFILRKSQTLSPRRITKNHTFVFLLIHHKELLLVALWKPTKTFLRTSETPPRTTMKFSRKPMKNIFLGISEKPQKLSVMQHRREFRLSNKIDWLFWILVRDDYELSFASLHTTILTFVSSVW